MPRYITVLTENGYMVAAYHEAGGDTGVPAYTTLGNQTYADGLAAEKDVLRMLDGRSNMQNS